MTALDGLCREIPGRFLSGDGRRRAAAEAPREGRARPIERLHHKKNDALHVVLFDEDQDKRTDVYSERWASLPKLVEEKLTALSRPGVKVTRHTK